MMILKAISQKSVSETTSLCLFAYFCSLCQAPNPKLSLPRKGGEVAEADTTNE
jgi:hypothetical protein